MSNGRCSALPDRKYFGGGTIHRVDLQFREPPWAAAQEELKNTGPTVREPAGLLSKDWVVA